MNVHHLCKALRSNAIFGIPSDPCLTRKTCVNRHTLE